MWCLSLHSILYIIAFSYQLLFLSLFNLLLCDYVFHSVSYLLVIWIHESHSQSGRKQGSNSNLFTNNKFLLLVFSRVLIVKSQEEDLIGTYFSGYSCIRCHFAV